jgi:hypothetical protein
MGGVRTSAIFYSRGIPKNDPYMGTLSQGNYTVVSKQNRFINSPKGVASFFAIMNASKNSL